MLQAARPDEVAKRQEGRVLEGRVADMDMRIGKARTDDASEVRLDVFLAYLFDDPVADANVALPKSEIVAVNYGTCNQNLA